MDVENEIRRLMRRNNALIDVIRLGINLLNETGDRTRAALLCSAFRNAKEMANENRKG